MSNVNSLKWEMEANIEGQTTAVYGYSTLFPYPIKEMSLCEINHLRRTNI